MNGPAYNAQQPDVARRAAVRDRAVDAFVANYIHMLSDRHGGEPEPAAEDRANPR